MLPIPEVTDIDIAFPARPPLPAWDDIPEDFRRERGDAKDWCEIVNRMFFEGGSLVDFGIVPKKGLDLKAAMRAIRVCLGSFEPKHEHKAAGVAYMLSEWFDKARQS